jgi:arginyl-tRNA synthetase
VFKTLELFGYEKAKKCVHLPYGLVVLPNGKMSSRKGTVILFSQLVELLGKQIDADYLSKYKDKWDAAELAEARHWISVATIKFGMLNHDTAKDIVFNMAEWTAHGGMNGPYMLYSYARTRSILEKEKAAPDAKGNDLRHTHSQHTCAVLTVAVCYVCRPTRRVCSGPVIAEPRA